LTLRQVRDFKFAELRKNRVISDVNQFQAGQHVEHINHYITDGEIALASLVTEHP
jgi:hypothetical protein